MDPSSLGPLAGLFGALRALHWLHWANHWQAQGAASYGQHLLFERMYDTLVTEIDSLAEKLVGFFGPVAVHPVMSMSHTMLWLDKWGSGTDNLRRALLAETEVLAELKSVYEKIKASDAMTLGLDDFIMATANTHETHVYLLKQSLRTASQRLGSPQAPTAEDHFFDAPRVREVREFAQSEATSNVAGVGTSALGSYDNAPHASQKEEAAMLKIAPPTPVEIVEAESGGQTFSTLSRYVVDTDQPDSGDYPDESPKHEKLVELRTALLRSWGGR